MFHLIRIPKIALLYPTPQKYNWLMFYFAFCYKVNAYVILFRGFYCILLWSFLLYLSISLLFDLLLVRRLRLRAFQRLDDAGASNLGQPSGVRLLLADGQVQEVPHQVSSSGHQVGLDTLSENILISIILRKLYA